MVTDWKTDILGNVPIKFIDGDRSSRYPKREEFVSEGIPFLNAESMNENSVNLSKANFITEEKFLSIKKGRLQQGDLILTTRGNGVGQAAFFNQNSQDALINAQLLILRPDEAHIDSAFLYYSFTTPFFKSNLKNFVSGSAQPQLPIKSLRNIEFSYPPLITQRKIADILSSYDRLIDNNNRRIALLEESIHLLYKEWFVRSRFPGYESVKVVDGIPEGWKFKKLEELGLLGRGKSKHRPRNDPSLYGGKFPFIQTREVKEASLYITNYSQTYNEKGLAQSKLWDAGTLLITIAANIAETAILTFSACFPDSVVGFIANSNQVSAEFIKYSIDTIKVRMRNVSSGAAQENLSLEKIRIFDFLVPDKETMQLFTRITNPMFLQMKNLLVTNENLRQARDLLLPRLMNGSIAV